MKLAAWCREKGLKEQAIAHCTEVTRIDPSRDRPGNIWVQEASQPLGQARSGHGAEGGGRAQKHADLYWKPRLEKLRGELQGSSSIQREKAPPSLAEITDPRAVPMIWRCSAAGNERLQFTAVQLFSQIEGPAASFWLAVLAVQSPSADVRQHHKRH